MDEKYNLYIDAYNLYIILNQSVDTISERLQSDLSYGQYVILKCIARQNQNKVTQRELDQWSCIRKPTLSQNLSSLSKKGYIRHQTISDDHRCKEIYLTRKAKDTIRKMDEEMKKDLSGRISTSDLEMHYFLIKKIKDYMQTKDRRKKK